MFSTDDLLGRRYEDTYGLMPDWTVIEVNPIKGIYVHTADGRKLWVPTGVVRELIHGGSVRESDKAGFVHE